MKYPGPTSIILLILISRLGFAQNWQFCHILESSSNEGAFLSDSIFLLNSRNVGRGCPFYLLKAFDPEGNQLWENRGGQVMKVTDTAIYTATYNPYQTDIPTENLKCTKISSDGRILDWYYPSYIFDERQDLGPPLSIDVSALGHILIATTEVLIITDDEHTAIIMKKLQKIPFSESFSTAPSQKMQIM